MAQATVLALVAPLLMRLPLHRIDRIGHLAARRSRSRGAGNPESADRLAGIVDTVMTIGHPLIRAGCTTRALTLWLLVRRAGIDADLCFGVGTVAGNVEGHSWVATEAGPVVERTDPRPMFPVVARLSGKSSTVHRNDPNW